MRRGIRERPRTTVVAEELQGSTGSPASSRFMTASPAAVSAAEGLLRRRGAASISERDDAPVRLGMVSAGGSLHEHVERAVVAEAEGWDGFFVPEGAYHVDPWALLAAIAVRTHTIRLGTMLTPLPWRRPWTVAAQAASVDQLSGGRVILSVGLGSPDTGRAERSDPMDQVRRAQLLDEGLEIINRLWKGETTFEGDTYHLEMSPQPPRT